MTTTVMTKTAFDKLTEKERNDLLKTSIVFVTLNGKPHFVANAPGNYGVGKYGGL